MKTFFSLLFSIPPHPIKAIQSLWVPQERIELEAFERADPTLFGVIPARGFVKKRYLRDIKTLMKHTHRFPANLRIYDIDLEKKPNKDFFQMIWEQSCSEVIYIGGGLGKVFEKQLALSEDGVAVWKSLEIHTYYWSSEKSVKSMLRSLLLSKWLAVKQYQNKIPHHCTNCDKTLQINAAIRCRSCRTDIVIPIKIPKTCYKLYEDICAYEKESGKNVLERAA